MTEVSSPILRSDLLSGLPDEWPHDLNPAINKHIREAGHKIVVLDDDPTGTQTIHGLPVLTEWSLDALVSEFQEDLPAFFILTNSRSHTDTVARQINTEIAKNLVTASRLADRDFVVISRSDSTLRGHFPAEMEALSHSLNVKESGWIVVPFFEEGGRYTIGDTHYVARGNELIPAARTEFARDNVFEYHQSDLRAWVAEKSRKRIAVDDIVSISIRDLREGGPRRIATILSQLSDRQCCVVNAAGYRDMEVFVLGLVTAEASGGSYLYRAAASFVRVRCGISPRPLLTPTDLALPKGRGALIIVGSHVKRSSDQMEALLTATGMARTQIRSRALLKENQQNAEISRVAAIAENVLRQGKDMLVFTDRKLITGGRSHKNLQIGQTISKGLVELLGRIQTRPRYILAKGGITSSDLATSGLGVRRAMVLGQVWPGVPVWQLGAESRLAGLTYIVFPGNVGDDDALLQVVKKLKH